MKNLLLVICFVFVSCAQTVHRSVVDTTVPEKIVPGIPLQVAAYEKKLKNPSPPSSPKPNSSVSATKPDTLQPSGNSGSPETTKLAPLTQRIIAYSSELRVGVFEPEKSAVALIAAVEKQGGYLKTRNNNRLVLRIPAQAFFAFIKEMESLGVMTSRSIQSQDITAEWVDTTLRLSNQLVTRVRLQAILSAARNVTETLAVEKEINRVSSEIERLKGRLRVYSNQVEFAVVEVNFNIRHGQEPITPNPIKISTPIYWIKQFDIVTLFRD